MTDRLASATPPAPMAAGLRGHCPRCDAATLFKGWVAFAARCRVCGLDFGQFNVGDGAAAFLTLVIGAIVTGLAVAVELIFSPPIWVHLVTWPLVSLALIIGLLRLSKGVLLALEYRHEAHEGRISRP